MKKRYLIIPLLVFALQLQCYAEEIIQNVAAEQGGWGWPAGNIDWSKTDPIDFLNMLKEFKSGYVTVGLAPRGWIKMEHVEQLMKLIDSKEPAASVVSMHSSYLPSWDRTATVGNEAMFLIEGFRKGGYPPGICSVYGFYGNPEEYREWYNKQKK